MKPHITIMIVAVACMAVCQAPAALLLSDHFDYTVGTTWDANGWVNSGISPKQVIVEGNLGVPGLMPPSGNMGSVTNHLYSSSPNAQTRFYAVPPTGYVYHSFIFCVTDLSNLRTQGDGFTNFYAMGLNNDFTLVGLRTNVSNPDRYDVGIAHGHAVSTQYAAWDTNGGNGYPTGQTNFMVLRITCTNINISTAPVDSYVAWVNPSSSDFGGEDPDDPPLLSRHRTNGHDGGTVYVNRVTFISRMGAQIFVDEVRVGTTWADVTPLIPEPVCALAALLGLGLMRRRS